jgi:hypothetical protein
MPLSALKNIRPSTRAVGFASEVGWLDKTLPQQQQAVLVLRKSYSRTDSSH